MESVGFKEWAAVCQALGDGVQAIILRKGGIAEGREGFSFKHQEFFLFPTWFHEQPEKVRDVGIEIPKPDPKRVEIALFAKLELSRTITSWKIAESLEPLHILQSEVVRERFDYDAETGNLHPHLTPLPTKGEEEAEAHCGPGLHIAFARIFRITPTWNFPNQKKYGGCRSWVNLPEPPKMKFEPVLSDDEHAKRRKKFSDLTS